MTIQVAVQVICQITIQPVLFHQSLPCKESYQENRTAEKVQILWWRKRFAYWRCFPESPVCFLPSCLSFPSFFLKLILTWAPRQNGSKKFLFYSFLKKFLFYSFLKKNRLCVRWIFFLRGKRSRWIFKTSAVVSCLGSVNVARWMNELAPSSSSSSSSSSSPHAMHAARAVWNVHIQSFLCFPGLNHWPILSDFCSQLFISYPFLVLLCYWVSWAGSKI